MAQSFIGKPISLISHSDVRYRGILAGIDPAASTIQLSNVYSMGTESRRPAAEFIPPVQEPYQYIIFRASEVKDLAVDEPAPRRSVHDDPAVLGASAPSAGPPYTQYVPPYPQPQPGTAPQPPQPRPSQSQQAQTPHLALQQPQLQTIPLTQPNAQASDLTPPTNSTTDVSPIVPIVALNVNPNANANSTARSLVRRPNSVHTAAASLETVERAIGDLRVANGSTRGHGHGHPRRGHGHGGAIKAGEIKVPATDFDFQGSNARFDKAGLAPKRVGSGSHKSGGDGERGEDQEDQDTNPSDEGERASVEKGAYNPQKSFFDSLSSSTLGPSPRLTPGAPNNHHGNHTEGRRGGGGGGGRNRREEERERNVATFGEPGGVGLMGPGAYVGGWGGYRRGGKPRRGLGVAGEGR